MKERDPCKYCGRAKLSHGRLRFLIPGARVQLLGKRSKLIDCEQYRAAPIKKSVPPAAEVNE